MRPNGRNERLWSGGGGEGFARGGVKCWGIGVGSGTVMVEERLELCLKSSQPLYFGLRDGNLEDM